MSRFYDARKRAGYSEEDRWFYHRDRELIEKMKVRKFKVIQGGKSGLSEHHAASDRAADHQQAKQRLKKAA